MDREERREKATTGYLDVTAPPGHDGPYATQRIAYEELLPTRPGHFSTTSLNDHNNSLKCLLIALFWR